ncbi:MAG TPA: alpha/beta fold hydrolase [Polyangiaceae bacterium]
MSERFPGTSGSPEPVIRFARSACGGRVAYAVHGEGPLLVCPPWWVSHVERDWAYAPFRAFFDHLARGLTVVRYDRPGNGLSDPAAQRPSLESEVAELASVVAALDVPRVSLFGMSSGAPPALAFAAREPERVERLVLYGAYAKGSELASPAVRSALPELVRAHWGMASRTLADVFVPDAGHAELEALAAWQRAASDGETAASLLELTYEMDAAAVLDGIRVPAFVLHRRDDRAVPFESGRRLAAGIPGARLLPLEGRAHPPWEGRQDVAGLVTSLFGGGPLASLGPRSAVELDRANCELLLEGRRIGLTRLELGALVLLEGNAHRVVSRDELIEHVWKQASVGSNVVDGVIRTLRKKLGAYRESIETVTGHGYRFRGFRSE